MQKKKIIPSELFISVSPVPKPNRKGSTHVYWINGPMMDRWMNKQLNAYKNRCLKLNKNKENLRVFLFSGL